MKSTNLASLYFNQRMAVLLGFGFAAGLPSIYRMFGTTLDTWLIAAGTKPATIGLFALVGLPLAFNFVWAPFMDRYMPRIGQLGRRRAWLVIVQALIVLGIIAVAFLGPEVTAGEGDTAVSLWPVAIVCFIVVFFVGMQDVVLDAYRTDVLPDQELGAGAAVFVNGYRIGMLLAGGGALFLAQYIDWRTVYLLLAALMAGCMLINVFAPEPPYQQRPATLGRAVIEPVAEFIRRKGWLAAGAVLVFIALFKLPDAMASRMVNVLLQDELGFTLGQLAVIRDWFGMSMVMVGALAGGVLTARMGLMSGLFLFLILQAVSNAGFMVLHAVGPSVTVFTIVIAVENFAAGMVTAGFIAFLMSQCHRKYSATQYAIFTSLMYGFGQLTAAPTGYLVDILGYQSFFLVSILAALPALLVLPFVGRLVRGDQVAAK